MTGRQPNDKKGGPFGTLHLISTLWFIGSVGYVLLSSAIQARLPWWAVFSLSGYSAVALFMLLSLYIFAIFRGATLDPQLSLEHPLTSSRQYLILYAVVPFLGAITGCLSGIGLESRSELAYRAALGTFVATFAGWAVLDPALAALEGLLPSSRQYRSARLAKERAIRQAREEQHQQLLAQVLAQQQAQARAWQPQLHHWAEELAGLSDQIGPDGFERLRQKAVQIGARAWQTGGISRMQALYEQITNQGHHTLAEYLNYWWDGIGAWRGPNA
ncbi:MAG: hypothetical protein QHH07_09150 [Sedimentisphaerales bacterium]|nr:hypothetical protein [Sedimentisphaerales bacterium]